MNLDRVLPIVAPFFRRAIKSRQVARVRQFEALPVASGRVVFLGDSITEWTAWEDWFPELPTTNRGIAGQSISDVRARLASAIDEPIAVSLLIGTNDLHGFGKSTDVEDIAEQMNLLVKEIVALAPSARLLINNIMPRSTLFRDRIVKINAKYERIAQEYRATYIDVWSALAGTDGAIRPEMTTDGLHLSVAGYNAWTTCLKPHLSTLR